MLTYADDTMDRIGSKVTFNQAGLGLLRDAWIAAKFGEIRQAEQVRLVADVWPDFELRRNERIESYEAVEADDPERRRGDEYRQLADPLVVEYDPVEDWAARAEQAPIWLDTACRKKAGKRYAARANLVIYLNLSENGIRQKEIEDCFASATSAAKEGFDSVWVLWKDRAYLVWKGGEERQIDTLTDTDR